MHLAEGAWAELHATALDLGLDWPEQRSPREQARSVVGQVSGAEPEAVASLEGLLVQVERGRYGRSADGAVVTEVEPEVRSRTVRDRGVVAQGDARHRRPRARLAGSAVAGVAAARVGAALAPLSGGSTEPVEGAG